MLAGRVDATSVGIEEERKEHVDRRRFAGAVDPAQEQPTTGEVQGLVGVLVHVGDTGPIEPPAKRHVAIVEAFTIELAVGPGEGCRHAGAMLCQRGRGKMNHGDDHGECRHAGAR